MSTVPARSLPLLDADNRAFWTGGANGTLMIHRCGDCGYRVHPPVNFCPMCEGRRVAPEPVSGKGVIATFTINHKPWVPGLSVPYVLALVALVEQPEIQLVTNIVHCAPENVRFGMPVRVLFEQHEDVWVPLFEPDEPDRRSA